MRQGVADGVFSWEYLGAMLANADAEVQARFLKSFLKECNSWGTAMQVEMQLSYVNGILTPDERSALGMLSYEAGK